MPVHLNYKILRSKRIFKPLKWLFIIFFLFVLAFFTFVEISNINTAKMTTKQKILKTVYPFFIWFSSKNNTAIKQLSKDNIIPPVSFYSLKDTTINGMPFNFEILKGKKVMLVNTASNCGYTNQYDDLQKLSELYNDRLVVIGFPANNFKEQEKGTNEEIADFCKKNFDVTFPLMKKSSVLQDGNQNSIFNWLTDSTKNGWNTILPSWNFCKYLVDEEGRLTNYFGPAIEPLGKEIIEAVTH